MDKERQRLFNENKCKHGILIIILILFAIIIIVTVLIRLGTLLLG